VGGHLLEVDTTFNTNQHRIPLLSAVGITNENSTFPVAFSFIPGEKEECFTTFFSALQDNIFTPNDCPEPAVVLAGKGAGMTAAVWNEAIPNSQFQLCNWHVHEAIVRHI
jgi:hypothetical protein